MTSVKTKNENKNENKSVMFENEYKFLKTHKIFPSCVKPISGAFLSQMNKRKSGLFLPSWGVFRLYDFAFKPMEVQYYFDPLTPSIMIDVSVSCFLDGYKDMEDNIFTRRFIKKYESLENFYQRNGKPYGISLVHDRDVKYKWEFQGLIPAPTKERIFSTRKLFDDTYLVSDISEIEPSIIVSPSDPLVIGRKNKSFYLIDKFACLTAEEYVSREFAI